MTSVGGKVYVGSTLIATGSISDQYPSDLTGDGVATGSSSRSIVTATASATPNTWGAWVEIDSSLAAAVSGVNLAVATGTASAGVDTSTLVQVGTGPGGSEAAWATMQLGFAPLGRLVTIPGYIAAGTRVAVRCQSVAASKTVAAVFSFNRAKELVPPAPTTFQANTATSGGLTITAPGSLNTKGAWTQITASTATAFTALHVSPSFVPGNSNTNASRILIDIGIGGSGSEVVLLEDLPLSGSTNESYTPEVSLTFGVDIPAGTRIAARYARANALNDLSLILVGA